MTQKNLQDLYNQFFRGLEVSSREVLIPMQNSNFYVYLDRYGNKKIAIQLVNGRAYPFGGEVQLMFIENNEVMIKDEFGVIKLEDMIKSQLLNNASQHFYGFDHRIKDITMWHKDDLYMALLTDSLVEKVFKSLRLEK